jgi:hypothetical protein
LPQAGDMVIIPADMTVLLDTDTPVIKLLLIKGDYLKLCKQKTGKNLVNIDKTVLFNLDS